MERIYLSNIVEDTYTNASGYALMIVLKAYLDKGVKVELSFKDATPTSSSFLNSSIGELIENFGFDKFKKLVSLRELSKTQANTLRNYFTSCGLMSN
ncbi:MAG: STAS-like domain-containing protein [Crocinitomicaceae bacterium]|nr:STAS-like domain-containing protein [Crocinitomicaceae bacterium]